MANARLDSLDTDIFFTLYKAQTVDEKTRNLKKESYNTKRTFGAQIFSKTSFMQIAK